MNRNTFRALFGDTLAQVRDNLAFRILVGFVVVLVALTFVIGFRLDGITVLFAWDIPYSELPGGLKEVDADMHKRIVDGLQLVFVNYVIGIALILVSVLTTSFFVPQALEKGLADTLLSKPVSRRALLLSRYAAGLLFIAPLSVVLVAGAHLGFLTASGYSDPGFLWNSLVLIYVFASFHAVSVAAGVFTRSAVAAFLLTLLFWFCNWVVHTVWSGFETERDFRARMELASEASTNGADGTERSEKRKETSSRSRLVSALDVTVAALHYALPKTPDAVLIATSLRDKASAATKELVDDDSELSISDAPGGFTREQRSSLNSEDGVLWLAKHPAGGGEASWRLRKQPVSQSDSRSSIVKALKKALEEDGNVAGKPRVERSSIGGHVTERFEWREKRGDETRLRRQWVFQGGNQMFTLDYDAEAEWAVDEANEHSARVFVAGFKFDDDMDAMELADPHVRDFGWSAPWRHNAWFSIGTTLAFIAAVLALGCWKLSRIDF